MFHAIQSNQPFFEIHSIYCLPFPSLLHSPAYSVLDAQNRPSFPLDCYLQHVHNFIRETPCAVLLPLSHVETNLPASTVDPRVFCPVAKLSSSR